MYIPAHGSAGAIYIPEVLFTLSRLVVIRPLNGRCIVMLSERRVERTVWIIMHIYIGI